MSKDKIERKEADWNKMPQFPDIDIDAAVKRSVTLASAELDALDAEAEQVSAELDLLHKTRARREKDFHKINDKHTELEHAKRKK